MNRLAVLVLMTVASVVPASGQRKPLTVATPDLAGTWALNRELSQFPREVGFGMDVVPSSSSDSTGATSEGRSGNPRSLTTKPQTEEVARNTRQLVDEVKNPPARLSIEQTPAAVTVTDARGRSRTFHADGREESQSLEAGPMTSTAKWEGPRFVVRYKVESGREVRYSYSRRDDPPQLLVQTEFLERGGHDTVTPIYEPAKAAEPPAPGEPASPERAAPPGLPTFPPLPSQSGAARQRPPAGTDPGSGRSVPAVPGGAAPVSPSAQLDQRPNAELMGLTALGIVVEELGPEAAACGLRQSAIEAAAFKSLTDAGLRVTRNSDEDSYFYVNVITTAMSTGFCFSRYDVYVYTNTAATLSYGSRPVLVQVSLLHKGGITGGGATSHGETVVRTIKQYVDQFAGRIRDVNK